MIHTAQLQHSADADSIQMRRNTTPYRKRKSTRRSVFTIPSKASGGTKKKRRHCCTSCTALGKKLHPVTLAKSIFKSIKQMPTIFWYFFVEAFLIPEYRPEWRGFRKWRPFFETPEAKEQYIDSVKQHAKQAKKKSKIAEHIPRPVAHNHAQCRILKINVSGKIYQTTARTLMFYPNTLLGNPKRLAQFYDPIRQDYFFDRNRTCFDAIMVYYQTRGTIRRPNDISPEIFEEEIQFYDLGQDIIDQLRAEDGLTTDDIEKAIPKQLLKRKLWLLFEYPQSSKQARLVAMLSIFTVLTSIAVFCLETMTNLHFDRTTEDGNSLDGPFFISETVCVSWFIFEFTMRACTAPKALAFFMSISNIIDFLSIIPYFMYLVVAIEDATNHEIIVSLNPAIQLVKLAKVLRILKLSRYNKGLQVLGKTLKASVRELMLLMFFLVIGVILFSSMVFFAERIDGPESANFTSIPDAFWWSIVTMTTVGYGDYEPKMPIVAACFIAFLGRLVGAVCAIAGVLTLALPVPVLVSNFTRFYSKETDNLRSHGGEFYHVAQCPCRSNPYGETRKRNVSVGKSLSRITEFRSPKPSYLDLRRRDSSSDSEFDILKNKRSTTT